MDDYEKGVQVSEAILSAVAEGSRIMMSGGSSKDVADAYNRVFIDFTIAAAKESGATDQLERYSVGFQEASALFMRSLYVIGTYVQHIANTEGVSLEEALDVARQQYDT